MTTMWKTLHQLAPPGCIRFAAGSCRGWRQPASSRWPRAGAGFGFARRTTSRESYRIMYLHVPAAIWSMGIYAAMAVAAFTGLVWQMKMASLAVAAMAPVGAVYTFIALVTGAAWGKPMWGTGGCGTRA